MIFEVWTDSISFMHYSFIYSFTHVRQTQTQLLFESAFLASKYVLLNQGKSDITTIIIMLSDCYLGCFYDFLILKSALFELSKYMCVAKREQIDSF